jgi:hypothetical protein
MVTGIAAMISAEGKPDVRRRGFITLVTGVAAVVAVRRARS